jgi:hypothetical protein
MSASNAPSKMNLIEPKIGGPPNNVPKTIKKIPQHLEGGSSCLHGNWLKSHSISLLIAFSLANSIDKWNLFILLTEIFPVKSYADIAAKNRKTFPLIAAANIEYGKSKQKRRQNPMLKISGAAETQMMYISGRFYKLFYCLNLLSEEFL